MAAIMSGGAIGLVLLMFWIAGKDDGGTSIQSHTQDGSTGI